MTPDQTELSTPIAIVEGYLNCWNETDPVLRRSLIDRTWTEDARSVDPLADVSGRSAIDAMISATQAQFPSHRFELDGVVSSHHDVVHWNWTMFGPDNTAIVRGLDVARLEGQQIAALSGFFIQ
jgi:hypothetical protein